MDAASVWQSLIAGALLGTERQSFTPPAVEGLLGRLLASIDPAEPECALLDAAAIVALNLRAGQLPSIDNGSLPVPCEPDDLPRVNAEAANLLAVMLGGVHSAALLECLDLAAKAGQRVPEEYLPALLAVGARDWGLRPAILAVIGRRGRWLAALNPDWRYAAEDAEGDVDIWRTGTTARRDVVFNRLRQADPARALALLESTWAEESAGERARFVLALREGLSMADEPFLEAALDDRSKAVHERAAVLLSELPESRLVQRMIARLRPLIAIKPGEKPVIEVTLPALCDEGMIRDGIEPKPSHERADPRESWLTGMARKVPPSVWYEWFQMAPAALIGAVDQRSLFLLEAWEYAASTYHDVAWAEALLNVRIQQGRTPDSLVQVLPPERQEALILRALREDKQPLKDDHSAMNMLLHCQFTWSAYLTRAVLDSLRRLLESNKTRPDSGLRNGLQEFSLHMLPALAHEAEAVLSLPAKGDHLWRRAADEAIALLYFRRDIWQAFSI